MTNKNKGFGKTMKHLESLSNFDNLVAEAMLAIDKGLDYHCPRQKKVFLELKSREDEVLRRCRFGSHIVFYADFFI